MADVLILVHNAENRRMLTDWLVEQGHHTQTPDTLDAQLTFDLCLLDTVSLTRYADDLYAYKQRMHPIFLPVLLLTPEHAIEHVLVDYQHVIDEVIPTPVKQGELRARMQILLRIYRLAQETHTINRALLRVNRAVSGSSNAITITDEDANIIYRNPAFLSLYHRLSGDLKSETIPNDYLNTTRVGALIREVAEQGKTWRGELAMQTNHGQPIHCLLRIDRLDGNANDPIEVIVICANITERKLARRAETEQRVLAEALRDTATTITSTLDLDEVLERILTNVGKVVPHDSANIMLIDDNIVKIARSRGYDTYDDDTLRNFSFRLNENPHFMALRQRSIAVPVMADYEHREIIWHGLHVESYIGSPIILEGETIGFINLDSQTPDFFTDAHTNRLEAFAEQVAIAIQNARLYERAQSLAVVEERQRLARDLHDAVTQTLFSAAMIAESLPRLNRDSPEKARKLTVDLHEMIRGALAETRALLVELRPEALERGEISELLRQLVAALRSRKRITVDAEITPQSGLRTDVKIVYYRVAQEAINNIIKHARAKHVTIKLYRTDDTYHLLISDDGIGYSPEKVNGKSMGVQIMYERCVAIDADLKIDTEPGRGTTILLSWTTEMVTSHE